MQIIFAFLQILSLIFFSIFNYDSLTLERENIEYREVYSNLLKKKKEEK